MMGRKGKTLILLDIVARSVLAALVSVLSFIAAFLIRFEFNVNTPVFDVWFSAYANNVIRLGAIAFFSFISVELLYRIGRWKFFNNLFKIFASTLLLEIATYIYMLGQIQRISRSIYIISFLLVFFLLLEEGVLARFFLAEIHRFKRRRKQGKIEEGVAESRKIGYLEQLDKLPLATIKSKIEGRNIMISGAAGEYGSALARTLLRFKVRRLILVDTNATKICELYNSLKEVAGEVKLAAYVTDIRKTAEMTTIFERYRPHIIFHAAGHEKYIDNKENRREFISANLCATKKMVALATKNLAERFVLISRQNASEPFVMRLKRREEQVVAHAQKKSKTQFGVYRFEIAKNDDYEWEQIAEKTFELFAHKEEREISE